MLSSYDTEGKYGPLYGTGYEFKLRQLYSTLEYYKQHTVFEGDEDCNLY